jgi:hypothetical protein
VTRNSVESKIFCVVRKDTFLPPFIPLVPSSPSFHSYTIRSTDIPLHFLPFFLHPSPVLTYTVPPIIAQNMPLEEKRMENINRATEHFSVSPQVRALHTCNSTHIHTHLHKRTHARTHKNSCIHETHTHIHT